MAPNPAASSVRIGASLALVGLKKYYGSFAAVRDLTLEVRAGEFLSLLGASGSGKSTALKMIAGLETPSGGQILIDGRDTTRMVPEARDIGMVFQDYALFPNMTVRQNIGFPLRMRRTPSAEIKRRVAEAMALVSIDGLEDRKPAQLSGGQQQRVAIARALVFAPKLLLLDEPLSALDRQLREQTKGEIKRLHQRLGVTIVYVTHDQSEALAMSDRVAVLHRGDLVGLDTPERLYSLPSSHFIAGFIGDANLVDAEIIAASSGEVSLRCALGSWSVAGERIRLRETPRPGAMVTAVIRPEHVRVAAADAPASSAVQVDGAVTEALYNGTHTRYTVACGKLLLAARGAELDERVYPPGTSVRVDVFADRTVLVDRPA